MGTRTLPREGREMGLREIRESKREEAMALVRRFDKNTMCEVLGVSYPTYCKLEEDPRLMTVVQQEKAAEWLGVRPGALIA